MTPAFRWFEEVKDESFYRQKKKQRQSKFHSRLLHRGFLRDKLLINELRPISTPT